jgi:hypothetical protein
MVFKGEKQQVWIAVMGPIEHDHPDESLTVIDVAVGCLSLCQTLAEAAFDSVLSDCPASRDDHPLRFFNLSPDVLFRELETCLMDQRS